MGLEETNLTDGTRDTRLIERAIREGWNIPEEVLQSLPLHALKIATKSSSERNRLAAMRILATMHGQNTSKKVEHEHKHAHVHASIEEVRKEVLEDPDYLEYLRSNAIAEEDGDSGTIREDSESR